ncbi:MAG TPA: response regulator transcription factor [Candidatus Tumulicola sp.]|nr:response regulator transcription factor [Candidatus Tumulicola sp.]
MITDVKMHRLILIESQLLFARALAQVLSADASISVSSIIAGVEDLPPTTPALAPDLVLVGIDKYSSDIAGTFATLKERLPQSRLCALTSFVQPDLMQRCLAAGADGFIIKDTSVNELISAIKLLADGTPYVDPRVAGGVLRRRAMHQDMALNELSNRETEIVRLIAQGLSNRDIGANLLLSEKTIKNHISRIFDKLQISARTGVAVYAIRKGIA